MREITKGCKALLVMGTRNGMDEEAFRTCAELFLEHGSGPFEVTGIGPKHIALKITGKNTNVPRSWVQLPILQSTE